MMIDLNIFFYKMNFKFICFEIESVSTELKLKYFVSFNDGRFFPYTPETNGE